MGYGSIIFNKVRKLPGKILTINNDGTIKVQLFSDGAETWNANDCIMIEDLDTQHLDTVENSPKSDFEVIANEIGKLVSEKNKAYGNSFADAEKFLNILFPNGIPNTSYSDMLCIVRIFDKLKRIATNKDAFGESPYRDLAGYAILGTQKDEKKRNG